VVLTGAENLWEGGGFWSGVVVVRASVARRSWQGGEVGDGDLNAVKKGRGTDGFYRA
jgi:hypothetical protein